MKKIFLTLALVLLASGCTSITDLWGGGQTVKELPPDVMVINNINVIPKQTVKPNDQFSVYYEVKNQDDKEIVPNVKYLLYDTGLCDSGTDKPTTSTVLGTFSPTESKLIEWTFTSPSKDRTAGLSVECPIRFKITYNYNAVSQIDVVVIDQTRLSEQQRSGKTVTYTPSLNVGRGPVKIYFDFGNTLPVKENTKLPVYVKVKDVGTGYYESIPVGKLTINSSSAGVTFQKLSCIPDYFNCGGVSCTNNATIPLIKKETFDILCEALTPVDADVPVEKTLYLSASINYDYDVYGQTTVNVVP
jgi:hypothetical protein